MRAFFSGAHPVLAELIGVGAIALICVVAVYLFTHDNRR